MTHWQKRLAQLGHNADQRLDFLKERLIERLRIGQEPVHILTYRGYGTPQYLYLRGRVLEDKGIVAAADQDTVWQNVQAMYRRFASNEKPGMRVQARFQDQTQTVITDDEGYFEINLIPNAPLGLDPDPRHAVWCEIVLTLLDQLAPGQGNVAATGEVLVPAASQFGVISDIDDTVVHSQATNFLRMAQILFLHNARTRLPFEGVAGFYQALQRGASAAAHNPIFYVSSSPWNIYDLLIDFMAFNEIPIGPLMLRDYDVNFHLRSLLSHQQHKQAQIERILTTYPQLPFILIGDSGQEDPEIYRQVVQNFPNRILAIYIRDVTLPDRATAIQTLAKETAAHNVEMILAPDTLVAAQHAVRQGFIAVDALSRIQTAKIKDEQAPSTVELLGEEVTGS